MSTSYCAVTAGGAKVSARTHDLQLPVMQGIVALTKGYSVWIKRYNPSASVRLMLDNDKVTLKDPSELSFHDDVRAMVRAHT